MVLKQVGTAGWISVKAHFTAEVEEKGLVDFGTITGL